ncbi:hypothetical protein OSTOST_03734 [Ostertagia ostertagi]
MCRSFYLHYDSDVTINGIGAMRFKMDNDTYDTTLELNKGYRYENTEMVVWSSLKMKKAVPSPALQRPRYFEMSTRYNRHSLQFNRFLSSRHNPITVLTRTKCLNAIRCVSFSTALLMVSTGSSRQRLWTETKFFSTRASSI